MISLVDAQELVLRSVAPLEPREISLTDAHGCVAAQREIATEAVPSFTNSSMDGFALRSADTAEGSAVLRIVNSVFAGDGVEVTINSGEAARIMTGAPLPSGADCVEMIERVVVKSETVHVDRHVAVGTFVRHPGDDVAIDDELLRAGDVLTAVRLGVLASQGRSAVRAIPRPRVGVLSTGNELTGSGGPLKFGAIRDSNRPMLLALLEDNDCYPLDLGTVADDHEQTRHALERAVATCDAVITTGGVSMGDVDYVKVVITELGGRSLHVALRPGKPFAFGVVGDGRVPVFGLPGNPVSTRVSYELIVRPALRRRAGHSQLHRLQVDAVMECASPREADGKVHVMHGVGEFREDGRFHVTSVMRHGSHLLHAIAAANVMLLIPDGDGVQVGDSAPALLLSAERPASSSPSGSS